MRYLQPFFILILIFILTNCTNGTAGGKTSPSETSSRKNDGKTSDGLNVDSLNFTPVPGTVLLTGIPHIRLTTVYKVNRKEAGNTALFNPDSFSKTKSGYQEGYNRNYKFVPGIEAVEGYNFINVSLYDIKENRQKHLFQQPVRINTLYYPSTAKDSLNGKPVNRDYFIVSVYNEDSNKDGYIDADDLKRLYLFNIQGERLKALIPENYSMMRTEFDRFNDLLYIFAQLDENENGETDKDDPVHIFWISLKNPVQAGRIY